MNTELIKAERAAEATHNHEWVNAIYTQQYNGDGTGFSPWDQIGTLSGDRHTVEARRSTLRGQRRVNGHKVCTIRARDTSPAAEYSGSAYRESEVLLRHVVVL